MDQTFDPIKHTTEIPKKICLITDHHLCINPRLWKEAFVYEKLGYEVIILTKWQCREHKQRDLELLKGHSITYLCYLNITPGETPEWKRFYYRLRKRIASELQRYFKLGGSWAINHAPSLLYKKALKLNADFYAAHLESAFYAGRKLINAGKKVSFDFEDWYSKDYLTPDRAIGLLQILERFALRHGTFCTAASEAMAKALQKEYDCPPPQTIYNSFPDKSSMGNKVGIRPEAERFKFVWTSRTVGPNRGIESFLDAAAKVDVPFDLHLIGDCDMNYQIFLKKKFPYSKGHQLIFHEFLSHDDLQHILSEFDAGLAIEQYTPESRNKTVTNKILQYLQAGLQVLATDTDGQKEIANYFPSSVKLAEYDNVESWVTSIEQIIHNKKDFNPQNQSSIFEKKVSWFKQEEKITYLIHKHL